MQFLPSICHSCALRRSDNTCDAFEGKIPQPILNGDFDHRLPHPQDNGKQWKMKPGEEVMLDSYERWKNAGS